MRRLLSSFCVCFARPASSQTTAAGSSCAANIPNEDPYNLKRFTDKQALFFNDAIKEIQTGRKTSHWSWFCIPTPPFVVDGVERGACVRQGNAG